MRSIGAFLAVMGLALVAALALRTVPAAIGGASLNLVEDEAALVLVGDVMLGRGVRDLIEERGSDWLLAEIEDLLQADLVLANLESPLAEPPEGSSPALNLAAGVAAADVLSQAGLGAVSLANNHALDARSEGLAATLAELKVRSIVAVGVGDTLAAAQSARVLSLNGVRLALLAYNDIPQASGLEAGSGPVVSELEPASMEAEVRRARERADVVVVVFHWGEEYNASPTPRQREMARRAREAGAQVVVGSHPHVIQPLDLQPDGVVAYSLGNFIFDQWRSLNTACGQALALRVRRDGLVQTEIVSLSLDGGRPRVVEKAAARPNGDTVFHWNGVDFESCSASLFYQAPAPEADLDGDGALERVLIEGGRLRILDWSEGQWREVWQTPSEWEVERVALGDVDHDGLPNVVFSLWRNYRERFGNQPFVFGYRDGEYRPVWRGSAVADPIRELGIGDVDGDGRDELVVLEGDPREGRDQAAAAVTVWRWSGWGFYLDWRSPLGRYHNLRLVDVIGDGTRSLDILVQKG